MSGSDCKNQSRLDTNPTLSARGYWILYNQRKTINKTLDWNSATQRIGHFYCTVRSSNTCGGWRGLLCAENTCFCCRAVFQLSCSAARNDQDVNFLYRSPWRQRTLDEVAFIDRKGRRCRGHFTCLLLLHCNCHTSCVPTAKTRQCLLLRV